MKFKKYFLVTGSNGFIGSHLAEKLVDNGEYVIGIDRHKSLPKNLEKLRDNRNFTYYQCDLSQDLKLLRKLISNSLYTFHFGAVVGVQNYLNRPMRMFESNVIGSYNLIKAWSEFDTPLMFASTSEIYGKNPDVPWNENSDRILGDTAKDRWSYSTGKALIEHLIIALSKERNLNYKIVRFFNVYGPRQKPIFVISRALSRALKSESIEIFDGGEQTRSYIFIDDAIDAILSISGATLNNIFNIGNDEEVTVKDLYLRIAKLIPNTSISNIETQLSHGQGYEDLPRRVPDISTLKTNAAWKPNYSLDKGLETTLDWINSNKWWLNLDSEIDFKL
jgi:nucleoside-diphosphate-sugar epimerase